MGKVEDALVQPFEEGTPHLVEEYGQDNGDGKPEDQGVDIEEQGVFKDLEEVGGSEKAVELLEAHPFAARDAQADFKILKGDDGAVHGHVFENDIEGQGKEQEDVKPAVPAEIPGKPGNISTFLDVHRILLSNRVLIQGRFSKNQNFGKASRVTCPLPGNCHNSNTAGMEKNFKRLLFRNRGLRTGLTEDP
jgi:hypothetical protein